MKDNFVSKNILRSKEYFELLVQAFPDISDLEDDIHYNMEGFAAYTLEQIKQSNWDKVSNSLNFQ